MEGFAVIQALTIPRGWQHVASDGTPITLKVMYIR
jgi:hypothetical protein